MTKAVVGLIIVSEGLCIALPATAYFEPNPDHFDPPDCSDRTDTTSEPCEPRFPLGDGKDSESGIATTFV